MKIEEKIKTIIANVININYDDVKITSDLRFELGADSLDIESLYSVLESEFGILCSKWDNNEIRTVQDVIDKVLKELNNKQGCCV